RIRTALTQVALHLTDGSSLEAAITAPRLHMEGGNTSFEDAEAWADPLRDAYPEARVFAEPHMFFGGCHATRRSPKDHFTAMGDPRRAGHASAT
ncbi:MAG: Gamma-glutamyltranspeptidase, partial [Pseudomonadota bacterium]